MMVPQTEDETRAEASRNIQRQQKNLRFFGFLHPISVCNFSVWLHRELLCNWGGNTQSSIQSAAQSVGTQFSLPHDTLPLISAWSLPSPLLGQH